MELGSLKGYPAVELAEACPMKLETSVAMDSLEPGKYYAIQEKGGHLLVMAGLVDSRTVLIILGTRGTITLDKPPVWVLPNSIPASTGYELKGACVEIAHKSGSTAPAGM